MLADVLTQRNNRALSKRVTVILNTLATRLIELQRLQTRWFRASVLKWTKQAALAKADTLKVVDEKVCSYVRNVITARCGDFYRQSVEPLPTRRTASAINTGKRLKKNDISVAFEDVWDDGCDETSTEVARIIAAGRQGLWR